MYHFEGISYPSEKDYWKKLRKKIQRLLLMCYVLIKRKKCLVYVSKLNSERKNKLFV